MAAKIANIFSICKRDVMLKRGKIRFKELEDYLMD
jgi:hypothetical protein